MSALMGNPVPHEPYCSDRNF